MAREPKRSQPGTTEYVQIRWDGETKNAVIDICAQEGCSLNAGRVEVVTRAVREKWGLPHPPPAVAPLLSPAEAIATYLRGEQILSPCGKKFPCEGVSLEPVTHDGLEFCSTCGIRLL